MLYTIKQIKRSFTNCMMLGFESNLPTKKQVEKDLSDGTLSDSNIKAIYNWYSEVRKSKKWGKKQNEQLEKFNSIMKTLWVEKGFVGGEDELMTVLAKYVDLRNSSLEEFKKVRRSLAKDIRHGRVGTIEKDYNWEFEWTFAWDNVTRIEFINSLSAKSKASLAKILNNNYAKLLSIYTNLVSKMPKPKNWVYSLNPINNDRASDYLKSLWYKFDSYFESEEIVVVFLTIWDYVRMQNHMNNFNNSQKLAYLLDFDNDATLWLNPNFNIWEAQSFYKATQWLDSDWINTLIENLWLWDADEFLNNSMSSNLYLSKQRFITALWTALNNNLKLNDLIKNWWVKEAVRKNTDLRVEAEREMEMAMEGSSSFQKMMGKLPRKEAKKLKDSVKLNGVSLILGWVNWIGADFDISVLTRWYVDSLQLWYVWGVPAIVFTKDLFAKSLPEWYSLKASLANFSIPVLSAWYTNWEVWVRWAVSTIWALWSVSYSPEDYPVAANVWVSNWGYGWDIWYSDHSIDVKRWIDRELRKMKKRTNIIKDDLVDWYNFNQSLYKGSFETWEYDEQVYNDFLNAYNLVKTNNIETNKKIAEYMMEWYLKTYENKLYSEAKWTKLSKLWVWLAMINWYKPLPYLTLGIENISQKWEAIKGSWIIQEEDIKEVSYEEIKRRSWLKVEEYKWKKVYSVPNTYWISSKAPVELEEANGRKYFYTDKNISVVEKTDSRTHKRWVVIWNWNKNIFWKYIAATKINEIKGSLKTKTKAKEVLAWNERFVNIKGILLQVEKKIDSRDKRWAWKKLRNNIAKMLRAWEYNENVWNEFKVFAKGKNRITWLDNSNLTPYEKKLILERVFGRFMVSQNALQKNWAKVWNEKTAKWVKNMTLKQFEENKILKRSNSFRKGLETAWFGNFVSEIESARKELLNSSFWKQKRFEVQEASDMIAFVVSKDWVTPMTWEVQIAWWKTVSLRNEELKAEMIENLPKGFVKRAANKLWVSENNLIRMLKWETVDGKTITYDTVFFKWWDCFNDAFGIKNMKLVWDGTWAEDMKIGIGSSDVHYGAENDTDTINIAIVPEAEKDEEEKAPAEEESEEEKPKPKNKPKNKPKPKDKPKEETPKSESNPREDEEPINPGDETPGGQTPGGTPGDDWDGWSWGWNDWVHSNPTVEDGSSTSTWKDPALVKPWNGTFEDRPPETPSVTPKPDESAIIPWTNTDTDTTWWFKPWA